MVRLLSCRREVGWCFETARQSAVKLAVLLECVSFVYDLLCSPVGSLPFGRLGKLVHPVIRFPDSDFARLEDHLAFNVSLCFGFHVEFLAVSKCESTLVLHSLTCIRWGRYLPAVTLLILAHLRADFEVLKHLCVF